MSSSFQVGTVVAYAGDLSSSTTTGQANLKAIKAEGWLLCDGTALDPTTYALLFNAIGFNYTPDKSSGNFNLPDYTEYFLRGTLGASTSFTDPDSAARFVWDGTQTTKKTLLGTITGPTEVLKPIAGSRQTGLTAVPTNKWTLDTDGQHSHTIRQSQTNHHAWIAAHKLATSFAGSDYSNSNRTNIQTKADGSGAHSHRFYDFDPKTEPVNMALYFIIKAEDIAPASSATNTVAGTIVATAFPVPSILPLPWLLCDGTQTPRTTYKDLNTNIGSNFGGDNVNYLNLPDLRGVFLRGSDHGSGRDLDVNSRMPLHNGGQTGAGPGSFQKFATGRPTQLKVDEAGAHHHSLQYGNDGPNYVSKGASGPASAQVREYNNDTSQSDANGPHTHSGMVGGDNQTCPQNLYVDYLIASGNIQEAPPIGTVMSFGGDATNTNVANTLKQFGWALCDGRTIDKSTFQNLFNVIGDTYLPPNTSPSATSFYLPDLRGRFVKGAGTAGTALGKTLAASTAGAPVKAITTTIDNAHQHTFSCVYYSDWCTHAGGPGGGWCIANLLDNQVCSDCGTHHHHVNGGGDKESRPYNVNVDFIIRVQ